jgi:hypothetical protein
MESLPVDFDWPPGEHLLDRLWKVSASADQLGSKPVAQARRCSGHAATIPASVAPGPLALRAPLARLVALS